MNFYLIIKVKTGGGGALVPVYNWEHIVNLNYRITWWIFTKLGKDKVLVTPQICIDFWAKSARGGSRAGPIYVNEGPLLQRTSSTDRKASATNQIHGNYLEEFGKKCFYFWFHLELKFWRVSDVCLDFVNFVYFNAISTDFHAVKSFWLTWAEGSSELLS